MSDTSHHFRGPAPSDQALPSELPEQVRGYPTVVAIGNFDGVHQGHQAVLREALAEARCRKLLPVALTFHPHPTEAVGRPSPPCLTPVQRKIELIRRVDPTFQVIVQHFDLQFASIPPEQFIREILIERLNAKAVRVGENFRFGARRAGDIRLLAQVGKQWGFDAKPARTVEDEGGRISSTRIRAAVAAGDLASASRMLTRPHALSGLVVPGQKRARALGFPTANLRWIEEAIPPRGVYAVAVDRLDSQGVGTRLGLGVCNVGIRPTVDAGFAVEIHVLDFDGDLYGQSLRVHLLFRMREERKFPHLDALREQIGVDVRQARLLLADKFDERPLSGPWF